jgi:hypothetical protein
MPGPCCPYCQRPLLWRVPAAHWEDDGAEIKYRCPAHGEVAPLPAVAEVRRVKFFPQGQYSCLRCGQPVNLRYNGGALDTQVCCGLVYSTEHVQTDLVITENVDAGNYQANS